MNAVVNPSDREKVRLDWFGGNNGFFIVKDWTPATTCRSIFLPGQKPGQHDF